MKKIEEKYLPIGTVAMLKGGTKRVMITGFCAMEDKATQKIWDYTGCMYPEGFLDSSKVFLFDHEQIQEVYHLGLSEDDEEKDFKTKLNELAKSL